VNGDLVIIGVDPGGTSGVAALHFLHGVRCWAYVTEVACADTRSTVESLLQVAGQRANFSDQLVKVVATERFVVGRRAARSSSASAGENTRNMVGALGELVKIGRRPWDRTLFREQTASTAKTWATDERLEAAGIKASLTKGLGHGRDAMRHALFAATRDFQLPDPLSRRAVPAYTPDVALSLSGQR
jgi:hypothetical protein